MLFRSLFYIARRIAFSRHRTTVENRTDSASRHSKEKSHYQSPRSNTQQECPKGCTPLGDQFCVPIDIDSTRSDCWNENVAYEAGTRLALRVLRTPDALKQLNV